MSCRSGLQLSFDSRYCAAPRNGLTYSTMLVVPRITTPSALILATISSSWSEGGLLGYEEPSSMEYPFTAIMSFTATATPSSTLRGVPEACRSSESRAAA